MMVDESLPPEMNHLELLNGLLEHYSPTGSEAGAVAFMVEAMNAFGYRSHTDEAGNAVGTIGEGPREILLLGHIDTVPGYIPVKQEQGRLFGRGAVDAKGPLAAFAACGAQVRIAPDWRITVIGAVGEEGNSGGAKYLCQNHPSPEMVLIGEPSGWDHITLGYKGSLWFDFAINRTLTHTAGRNTSACEGAVAFWNLLSAAAKTLNIGQELVFNQLTPSLHSMHSEQDGFNEVATMKINLRIPPGMGLAAVQELLESTAASASALVGGESRLDLAEDDFTPAYRAEKNTVLVRSLLAGIRKAGGRPRFSLKTGTADLNLVGPAWGRPTAAYGPGDSNLDHTPGEYINISEYLFGIAVLVHALEKIQGIA